MTHRPTASSAPARGLSQGPVEWALLLTLVVLWGSAFVLIHVALESFTPVAVAGGRLAVGALALFLILLVTGKRPPRDSRAWRFFATIGFVGNALPFFLISWGQQQVPSGLTGILMAVMPLGVLVMAHFFVPGERLSVWRVAGFTLGFGGVVVLTGPEALKAVGGNAAQLASQLAILAGALCYGIAAIVARRGPTYDPVVTATCVLAMGGAMTAGFASIMALRGEGLAGLVTGPVSAGSAGALLALGALSTALATVVFFNLVRRAGPTFQSLINYLIPVWAVFLGAVALGERLPPRAFAALALILGGIVLARFRDTSREKSR